MILFPNDLYNFLALTFSGIAIYFSLIALHEYSIKVTTWIRNPILHIIFY